ncbi:MAG: N-acetylmuramic acid 6-phosphate etherase [Luteibaculaceae bacterium]
MIKTTEQEGSYKDLDKMDTLTLLQTINKEDKTVAYSVEQCLNQIEFLVDAIYPKMQLGGRLFYAGAGTSGRLGVVDASECPPTFGLDYHTVIGLIAGGDAAIRKAVENAEDSTTGLLADLEEFKINPLLDSFIGIAASGTTPYVVSGLKELTAKGFTTGCITCNKNSPLAAVVSFPVEAVVGAEVLTGSTRMKAGTAQKMILNMISTTLMVKLGYVKGNKMVDMRLSNSKLVERGTKMIMQESGLSAQEAESLLLKHGSVRAVLQILNL